MRYLSLILVLFPAVAWGELVDSLRPNADGSISQWTASAGNKYETVDENSPNGNTDYVLTTAIDDTIDFTCSNTSNVSTPDSAWIKVNWTWTRSAGSPQDLNTYYNIGSGWVSLDVGATTKSGVYVTDSVKLTNPTTAQLDALQVRAISTTSSGSEEWRVTWWVAVAWEAEAETAGNTINVHDASGAAVVHNATGASARHGP